MKTILIIFTLFLTQISLGQEKDSFKNFYTIQKISCDSINYYFNKKNTNTVWLHFPGAGMIPRNSKIENEYYKKFHIKIGSMGCVVPLKSCSQKKYEKLVYTYLDKKYGNVWREEFPEHIKFLVSK
jgi:hypothetical protein